MAVALGVWVAKSIYRYFGTLFFLQRADICRFAGGYPAYGILRQKPIIRITAGNIQDGQKMDKNFASSLGQLSIVDQTP